MDLAAKKASLGFTYSISPAKKQANKTTSQETETHLLILAPFNKAPKINFGDVKLGEFIERNLRISNPQDFSVGILINCIDLHIEDFNLAMEKESSVDLKLKWQPEKAGNYKFSIKIEVANSRLKFIVHGFGNCIEPPKKKPFKKVTVLQPVRSKATTSVTAVLKESNAQTSKQVPSGLSLKATSASSLNKKSSVPAQKENAFMSIDATEDFEIVKGEPDYRRHTTNIPTPKSKSISSNKTFNQLAEQTTFLSVNNLRSFSEASDISTSTQILRSSSIANITYEKSPDLDDNHEEDELNTTPKFGDKKRILEDIAETPVFKPITQQKANLAIRVENVIVKEKKPENINKLYDDVDDEEALAEKRLIEFRKREMERLEAEKLEQELAEKRRIEDEQKLKAVLMIQRKIRLQRFRAKMKYYRVCIMKLQRKCRVYLDKKRREHENKVIAAVKIQQWVRSMKLRFNFLKLKRLVTKIKQNYLAKKAEKREEAAQVLQQWYRLMKPRFEFIRIQRAVRFIQQLYKARYERRNMAALKIQNFYRMYKLRQYEYETQHRAASIIQAYWKGYRTRKAIKIDELIKIRQRISVFIQCRRSGIYVNQTLGYRIKRSLNILIQTDPQPSIQQIIQALMELDKVTRLSKECCVIFIETQGACDLLYQFVSRCNRSIPHTDLINYCINILINLAKTPQCLPFIIDAEHINEHLGILLYLIQAHYIHNPQLFINVCILLILITSQQKDLDYLIEEFRKDGIKKKLIAIYQSLEKRMQNKTHSGGPNIQVAFTYEPEWSLSKKRYTYFNDSLSALNYLLFNALQYQHNDANMSINESISRTPSKVGQATSRLQGSINKNHLKPMDKSHYSAISSSKRKL